MPTRPEGAPPPSSPHRYRSPLDERYASPQMSWLFSDDHRFRLWRRLWLALAENQAALGLAITQEQLQELRDHLDDIDLEVARRYERALRHDVMAHVHALGDVAPTARPIVHLGATSCYVTDNADLFVLREGLRLLLPKLAGVIRQLSTFAHTWRSEPTLGFTHFQPAQPTTVGKRACLWIQDLLIDLASLERQAGELRFRGAKGTTGTQASFLDLFDGDHERVRELDRRVAADFGFTRTYAVTGQTYPRKVDHEILAAVGSLGATAHRIGTDLRLLQHLKEVEEPFGSSQIGSSAMPYKRNPMRAERVCALSRHLMVLPVDTAFTAATQWLERTLDDSAVRRIALGEAFLAADGVLEALLEITAGLEVHPAVVRRHLSDELPFLASEAVLMAMVRAGADRQEVHEWLRQHALDAGSEVKQLGRPNDLVDRLLADPRFRPVHEAIPALLDARRFVGRAPEQVAEFLVEEVGPALAPYADAGTTGEGLRV